jgi:isopropylmalate/homocitrate/citramalate synthase
MRPELEEPWLYEKPWYKPGKWDVTQFTYSKSVLEKMPLLSRNVLPSDTTLREGLEMAGVHLSLNDYVEVAVRLEDLGVKEIEIGYASNTEHLTAIRRIADAGVKSSKRIITRWIHGKWKEEIDAAVKAGTNVIKIQTAGGRLWRTKVSTPDYYQLWVTNQLIPKVIENIKYIKNEYGLITQVGVVDATRTEIEWLKEFSKASVDAGADRVSFSDSRGVATPPAMQYLCEEIRKVVLPETSIQVHCHSDYGMAVANTICAVQGSANSFDCTINGLGDRAGNASLEECCVALECCYGVKTGIKLEKLRETCKFMEKKTGIKMGRTKPVTGDGAFLEESESHLERIWIMRKIGLTDDNFLAFNPNVVGQVHTAVWGSTSLRGEAIRAKIDLMGLSYTDNDIATISKKGWEFINTKTETGEAWITDENFEKLIKETLRK